MKIDKGRDCLIGRGKQLIEPRKNFTIRLSDEEREQVGHDARVNNMKASDYVRYLITHADKVDTSLHMTDGI